MEYNVQELRKQFPILDIAVHQKPLVYLDNAATTQKPECVIDAIARVYGEANANVHRGVHYLSQLATERHEQARKTVAGFIHAPEAESVIFTRGTTDSINLVASSYGRTFFQPGGEIIISTMEHHSNIVPWQMIAKERGAVLRIVRLNECGEIDMEHYRSLLNDKTVFVAVSHVSNVLGTVNPVKQMIESAHERGVPVLVDGAQAIAHTLVDVRELDADFYAFSAHKIYGPNGIGVLYGKRELLDKMPPYQGGGEMIKKVTFQETTYNELPFKFEAGTPDYVGSVAMARALDFVESIGVKKIAAHEHELLQYATSRMLEEIPGLRIIGNSEGKAGVISFVVDRIHPYDLGMLLDRLGIAIRTGHHCAEPLLDSYGLTSTARISFGLYNTGEEVDMFMDALKRVVGMFS
ncbi:Cysteine desulfurase [Porphyromonas macacae]|uniref:Probable cysteine desulfurase n=1 Tax=Porphyromonas macacae TaxID=28115 RepID=A0A379E6P4_9PORP|nr:cysteine desulfurase [Porphyromonas macacae]SUB88011.1 Cysteine desulfurase [Porphyromonas macacae]